MIAVLSISLFLCLVLSAFFSASEMSYSSCNILRLENVRDSKEKSSRKAGRALKLTENYDRLLGAILIGNNLVNIAASSIGSVLILEIFGSDKMAWLSTLVITVFVIIFGETIPKIIAKKIPNNLAIAFSFALNILVVFFTPLIKLCISVINIFVKKNNEEEKINEDETAEDAIDELSQIIDTAEDEQVLDENQTELVKAAIDFLDVPAFEAMSSRVDIEAIDIDDDFNVIDSFINEKKYSRIPVYKDSIDNIIGILQVNRYLKARADGTIIKPGDFLLKPCYVYKTNRLTSILSRFKKENQHMAIVCDEYGGTLGIITMEDILEEIVGEIWDEKDTIEDEITEISDTKFEIDGDLPVSDFCELININQDELETDSDTAGGWALEHFENYPGPNAGFTEDNIKVKILDIEERRVNRMSIEILKDEE